jgi:TPR repeat protein
MTSKRHAYGPAVRVVLTALLLWFGRSAVAYAGEICPTVNVSPDLYELYDKWFDRNADDTDATIESASGSGLQRSREAEAALRFLQGRSSSMPLQDGLAQLASAKAQGDPLALYLSGMLERKGKFLHKDINQAHQDFQRSAELGFVPAHASVAVDFLVGAGVPKDFAKAREHAQIALDKGYLRAAQVLGVIYSQGLGVDANPQEGLRYAKMAATIGDPVAQLDVARALYFGEGTDSDPEGASLYAQHSYCSGMKAAGLLLAKIELSKMTANGIAAAIDILKDVSASGDANAALVLSDIYLDPKYGHRDPTAGLDSLSQAMQRDPVGATYRYGAALLRFGKSKAEYANAEALLKASAESGDARAQYDLGVAYARGSELDKDLRKARQWFARAAANGSERAKAAIVDMDRSGE